MNFRKLTDADKPIIAEWISRDPDHSAKGMIADYFFVPDTIAFAIEDDDGPIMFVRLDKYGYVGKMHIQFDEGQRRRTAIALIKAFPRVRDSAKGIGVTQIVFDSVSPSLIAFCKKRLGFQPWADRPDHYIASI